MPLFEYKCKSCGEVFSALRTNQEADQPSRCPRCGSERTRKVFSPFALGKSTGSGSCSLFK